MPPTGPLAACVVGSTSYQEGVELVTAIELAGKTVPLVTSAATCGSVTQVLFNQIRRFLISFLDMVAFVRQQYNEGNLSASTCEGFTQTLGVQPSTCQCVLAQLCARFLTATFPSPTPLPPSTALAYLLTAVLKPPGDGTASTGSPELINNVLLMANVMQTPIDWAVLTSPPCNFDSAAVCTMLTYAAPGLLQSALAEFSLCGTTGVPFTLASVTSIPNRFIDSNAGCAIACGEWLSEFQKDADNCTDYVESLFNFDSPTQVANNICQSNGIFLGPGASKADQSACSAMFSTSLSTLQGTAIGCCKSSRSAARQKGLRWFLLGLGIACAIILIVGVAGLFKKLSVLSKKNTLNTVYAAKAAALTE